MVHWPAVKYTGNVPNETKLTLLGNKRRVDLEQDVLETCSKIRAVNGSMTATLRVVQIFTFAAVKLCALDVGKVGKSGRKESVGLTGYARAFAKVKTFVFL